MSEPTIEELRRWSAEWLGWEDQKFYWIVSHTPWKRIDVNDWRPDERIEQAWLLVDKMQADGYWLRMEGGDINGYVAKVYFSCGQGPCEKHATDWNSWHGAEAEAESFPLAILRAVYTEVKLTDERLAKKEPAIG